MPKKRAGKKEKKAKKETIFIFGAHPDDFVLGVGGTLAKYKKENKKVLNFVFSYGEKSHPWLKVKVAQKIRWEEALQASQLLGCKTFFFDLKEFNFPQAYQEKDLEKTLLKLLHKHCPSKIFTHSPDDPHPDHQALHKITLELWEKSPLKPEVYIYSIWNPLSLRTQYPALYEDISSTFSIKRQALKLFRSQKLHTFYPSLLMFYRAFKDGLKIKKRYAEKFYRIK